MEQTSSTRSPQTPRQNIPDTLKVARQAATPLIAISTPDQMGMVRQVAQSFNGDAPPILVWSEVGGIAGMNPVGNEAAGLVNGGKPERLVQLPQLVKALELELPPKSLVFVINSHLGLADRDSRNQTCLTMARDELASKGQTIVLLAPAVDLPASLNHDVMILDDPLPGTADIKEAIHEISSGLEQAEIIDRMPTDDEVAHGIDALRGLSSFESVQALSMAMIDKQALDAPSLQDRRNAMIDATPGLQVKPARFSYDDIRGIEQARSFMRMLFNGPEAPSVILWIDEIEKKMAGSSHNEDHEGGATKGDELQVLLTEMEQNGWTGQIDFGHPGTAKSMLIEATGPTFDVQTIALDIAGTRSKYVGESEQNIRSAMRIVKSIGGERVYVMATCNELDRLKPELKRRFTDGVFFFDLPSQEELTDLWVLYRSRYGLGAPSPSSPNPPSEGWTGAEVRNACRLSYRLGISLAEAAKWIIPVIHTDPNGITRRRQAAHGKFTSASLPGAYVNVEGKKTKQPRHFDKPSK